LVFFSGQIHTNKGHGVSCVVALFARGCLLTASTTCVLAAHIQTTSPRLRAMEWMHTATHEEKVEFLEQIVLLAIPNMIVIEETGQYAIRQHDLDAAANRLNQLRAVLTSLLPGSKRENQWLHKEGKWPHRAFARHTLRLAGHPFHAIALGNPTTKNRSETVYTLNKYEAEARDQ
jgi:hypothetical protein